MLDELHPAVSRRQTASRRQAGFTLVELVVAMAVSLMVLLAIFAALDMGNQVGRVEMDTAELQQSLRGAQRTLARELRMAGRGGLSPIPVPGRPVFDTPALTVTNQVAAGTAIAPGFAALPTVRQDTDVVTVRGVFNAPIYQINAAQPASFVLAPDPDAPTTAETGSMVITNPGPTGVPQDLTPLRDAIAAGRPEALILVSPLGPEVHAVVELDASASDAANHPASVRVNFRVTGGTHTAAYRALFPAPADGLPGTMRTVASVGLLEEYRYFLPDTEPPVLSRARFFPGTNDPWGTTAAEKAQSLTRDVAGGLVDLQVALAFDSSLGGGFFDQDADNEGDDDRILETTDGDADDWLFNSDDDDGSLDPWQGPWTTASPRPQLYFVRFSFLGRTDRFERRYVAPALTSLEDRTYDEPLTPSDDDQRKAREFRRGMTTTVVEMRNL